MNSKNIKRIITTGLELFFIVLIILSLIKIINWMTDNNKNREALNESKKSVTKIKKDGKEEYKVDFEKLKKQNADVVAWLKVDGVSIDYPVVKTNNNDYYIYTNLNGEYNEAGWIFMDYKNKLDGTDKNIVIYGHGRLDGSMFGRLKNTLLEDWQNKKHKILLITETGNIEYQVFSTYKISVEDYYITTDFYSDESYAYFLETIKSRSNHDYGVELNTTDQVLTLSTCDVNSNYRIVLHAKRIVK